MPRGDGLRDRGVARGRIVPCATLACIVATFLASSAALAQKLRVVATTSDLASLAEAVTGDLARVETIIPPSADPEAFEPRPSDLARLKGASVVVRVGLGYDHWLDKLLSLHGDAAVNRRGAGYVDASFGIPLLEVKGSSVDPANRDGHAHGLANPHYWLDPVNAEIITGGIAEAGIRAAPEMAEKIIANRDGFLVWLKARLTEWEQLLAPHRAAPLIAYHNTWPYFARRFRLNIVDVIENKAGVTPSPGTARQTGSDDPRNENTGDYSPKPFEPKGGLAIASPRANPARFLGDPSRPSNSGSGALRATQLIPNRLFQFINVRDPFGPRGPLSWPRLSKT